MSRGGWKEEHSSSEYRECGIVVYLPCKPPGSVYMVMATGTRDIEIPSPPKKHKHRSFTLEFKVGVVDWVELHSSSLRAAASHFGLDRKVVRAWLTNREVLR